MPAPATTTIFFLRRRTLSRRSNWASPASSRLSRSRCSVQRGLRSATLRLLAGGGSPSVRTWISATSTLSCSFIRGEALPDCVAVELGDGYRTEGFMVEAIAEEVWGGREGDRDMSESGGEEERIDGVAVRSDRGEDTDECVILAGVSMISYRERVATSMKTIGCSVVRGKKYLNRRRKGRNKA